MPSSRALLLLWLVPLLGCGAGEAVPPASPAPLSTPSVDSPAPEPGPSLEERWRAPFAVISSGRPTPRPERVVVVVRPATSPSPDPTGSEAEAGTPRTHTVGPGDTLWGIARRYGVSMERIRTANRLPDERVRLGQMLIIPTPEEER